MGYRAKSDSIFASTAASESFDVPTLATPGSVTMQDDAGTLGDGDGIAEPGEAVRVSVPLAVAGGTNLTNVKATLTSSTAGVTVVDGTATYGALGAGGSAVTPAAPFTVALPPDLPCGAAVSLTLALTSDQGSGTASTTLRVGSGATATASGPISVSIPDATGTSSNPVAGALVSTPLTVPAAGRIGHLQVRLSLNHTYTGDLHVSLKLPSGKVVSLMMRAGAYGAGGYDGLNDVVFDDAAANPIQSVTANSGLLTGSYRPAQPFDNLSELDRQGTWTLRAYDAAPGDAGAITGWSIVTDQPTCASVLPGATTGAASGVTQTASSLQGNIDPKGTATKYRFDYGTTTGYGSATPATDTGSTTDATSATAALSSLTPGTTYHYRAVALRAATGTVVALGDDQTFTTQAPPSVVVTASPTPAVTVKPSSSPAPSPSPTGTPTPTPTAKATVTGAKLKLKKSKLTATFSVTGASGAQTVAFKTRKKGKRKAIALGRKTFTVPASGPVKVTIKLKKKTLRKLCRAGRKVKVTATFGFGVKTTLTLKR